MSRRSFVLRTEKSAPSRVSPRAVWEAEGAPRNRAPRAPAPCPSSHAPAPHAAWVLGAREGARVAHPPRISPSTTATTVESSSQLFLRKRFQSHPFLAGFPIAGAGSRNHNRGGRYCAWGSPVRAGAAETLGLPVALRRSGGGLRARGQRVCARCRSRHLSSRAAPAARAVRGGRARLLLPPPRVRRPGQPARKEGGAAGPGGGCVRGAPGVPAERAWGASRCGCGGRVGPRGSGVLRPRFRLEPFAFFSPNWSGQVFGFTVSSAP